MAPCYDSSHLASADGNRFTLITPDNHSAWLWVATLLSLIYAVLFLAVRLGFLKRKAHGLDDVVLISAHLVGPGMWGLMFASLSNGHGQSLEVLSDAKILYMQQHFFASRIMFYIALALSKCSMLIVIQIVFTRDSKILHVANAIMTVIAMWGIAGVLTVFVGCSPGNIIPKPGSDYCVDSIPWLKAVAAIDVLTELATILLPMLSFYNGLTSTRHRVAVVLAFSSRVLNIVFALLHLFAYSDFINNHKPAIGIVASAIWQSIILSYSLISVTTPSLKGFTQVFMTVGVALGYETTTSGNISRTNRSYKMRSLSRSRPQSKISPQISTK